VEIDITEASAAVKAGEAALIESIKEGEGTERIQESPAVLAIPEIPEIPKHSEGPPPYSDALKEKVQMILKDLDLDGDGIVSLIETRRLFAALLQVCWRFLKIPYSNPNPNAND